MHNYAVIPIFFKKTSVIEQLFEDKLISVTTMQ